MLERLQQKLQRLQNLPDVAVEYMKEEAPSRSGELQRSIGKRQIGDGVWEIGTGITKDGFPYPVAVVTGRKAITMPDQMRVQGPMIRPYPLRWEENGRTVRAWHVRATKPNNFLRRTIDRLNVYIQNS